MPAIQTNAQSFLVNTDYPFDKIISLKTGSFTVIGATGSGSTPWTTTIPHNLPFIPLAGGSWSFTADFNIQYEFAIGTFPAASGYVYETVANVCADATNYYVLTDNNIAANKTIYYRIYGFQPSTSSSSIAPIASQGDNFLLSTTYNNTKIFMFNTVSLPAASSVNINVPISHGLGYIPQTTGWITAPTYNGSVTVTAYHPFNSSSFFTAQDAILCSIDQTNINFTVPAFSRATTAFYTLYLDA